MRTRIVSRIEGAEEKRRVCSASFQKGDADGGRSFDDFASGAEGAGRGIDAEDDYIVGLLIGGEEEFAGRVDGEVARGFSHGWIFIFEFERALRGIDGKGGDGVDGGAVGSVKKFSVGMHGYFGGLLWTRIIFSQRRKRGER